jgi:hypothetical protein
MMSLLQGRRWLVDDMSGPGRVFERRERARESFVLFAEAGRETLVAASRALGQGRRHMRYGEKF